MATKREAQFIIKRDGKELWRGPNSEVMRWFHRHVPYSMDHATKYEGYSVHPVGSRNRSGTANRAGRAAPLDEQAAVELDMYARNEGSIYPMRAAIEANLEKRFMGRGLYQTSRAIDAFMPFVERAAKMYAKEYANPSEWNKIFSVATRREVAREFVERFEVEARIRKGQSNRSGGAMVPKGSSRGRKTRDEYRIEVNYGYGHGWEHEISEDTLAEARKRRDEYRLNAPQYPVRIRKRRVKL